MGGSSAGWDHSHHRSDVGGGIALGPADRTVLNTSLGGARAGARAGFDRRRGHDDSRDQEEGTSRQEVDLRCQFIRGLRSDHHDSVIGRRCASRVRGQSEQLLGGLQPESPRRLERELEPVVLLIIELELGIWFELGIGLQSGHEDHHQL